MCKNKLAGILVLAMGCDSLDQPSFYTDVTRYEDWINENGQRGVEITFTCFLFILIVTFI